MERNTKTILDDLQVGDRFYKSGDNAKTVYEVIEKTLTKIVCAEPAKLPQAKQVWQLQKRFLPRTDIIFLWHTVNSIHNEDKLSGII